MPLLCSSEHAVAVASAASAVGKQPTTVKTTPPRKRRFFWHREKAVFGTPLEQLPTSNASLVPMVLVALCDYVLKYGTQSEGIFRVSGSRRAIDALRAKIDRDGEAEAALAALAQDKGADGDIHTVTGALKLFLRTIPDGLVPAALSEKLVALYREQSWEELPDPLAPSALAPIHALLRLLSPQSYAVLAYLLDFLAELATHSPATKMSAENLAIVFAPNIFATPELELESTAPSNNVAQLAATFGRSNHTTKLLTLFIRHQAQLFDFGSVDGAPLSRMGLAATAPARLGSQNSYVSRQSSTSWALPVAKPALQRDASSRSSRSTTSARRALDLQNDVEALMRQGEEAGESHTSFPAITEDVAVIDLSRSVSSVNSKLAESGNGGTEYGSGLGKVVRVKEATTPAEPLSSLPAADDTIRQLTSPQQQHARHTSTPTASPSRKVLKPRSPPTLIEPSNTDHQHDTTTTVDHKSGLGRFEEPKDMLAAPHLSLVPVLSNAAVKSRSRSPSPGRSPVRAQLAFNFASPSASLMGAPLEATDGPGTSVVGPTLRPLLSHVHETIARVLFGSGLSYLQVHTLEAKEVPSPSSTFDQQSNSSHLSWQRHQHAAGDGTAVEPIAQQPPAASTELVVRRSRRSASVSEQVAERARAAMAAAAAATAALSTEAVDSTWVPGRSEIPSSAGTIPLPSSLLKAMTKEAKNLAQVIKAFDVQFEEKHGHKPHGADREAIADSVSRYRALRNYLKAVPKSPSRISGPIDMLGARRRSSSSGSSSTFSRGLLDALLPSARIGSQSANLSAHDKLTLDYVGNAYMAWRATKSWRKSVNHLSLDHARQDKNGLKDFLTAFDRDFEAAHGRKPTRADKVVLRSLYRRYNDLKKRVEHLESQTVMEEAEEDDSEATTVEPAPTSSEKNVTAPTMSGQPKADASGLWATRTVPSNRKASLESVNDSVPASKSAERESVVPASSTTTTSSSNRIDTAVLQELLTEKTELQKQLFKFQNDFQQRHGRTPRTASERQPMAAEYRRYKELKEVVAANE